ncbi:MAG: hypothetical protein RRA94_16660 [Bacteroidota bacterium]|nr:hypothetical protein [Bacteroidota bacterium]
MDPNLFHLDWERTFEALVGVVVLSFIIERAMAIVFESRWWIGRYEDVRVARKRPEAVVEDDTKKKKKKKREEIPPPGDPLAGQRYPVKEVLTFIVALVVCWHWDFDAVSIILLGEATSKVGIAVTAAVIAGGSKASIKLFHDVLDIRNSAVKDKQRFNEMPNSK